MTNVSQLFPHEPMPHHPDAQLFPMMNDTELAELSADIAANGLQHAIKVDPTSRLLVDGRNRERACFMAGVEPYYERLGEKVDIFSYIVSANLRRRHLTDEQRRDIIRIIAERNPDKSNRQIAKIAGVNPSTVDRTLKDGEPTAASAAVGSKYSVEQVAAIEAHIEAHRGTPEREVARLTEAALGLAVSLGTIQRYRRRLDGEAPRTDTKPVKPAEPAPAPRPTLQEVAARRLAHSPRFDTLTREERGMGTREHGAEQHPDYPPGWTRDSVHREKFGRIQLGTPAEIAERELIRRAQDILGPLKRLFEAVEQAPTATELHAVGHKSRETIDFQLKKLGPQVVAWLNDYLRLADEAEKS